ncbi:SDR family oxidoreductase [Alkanindiges illinoisensis]|uniref:SDR family oxidoreductase n=1 Tax=Alkanindiges illinoisensis TaxID=197183 RepID=UPI00047E5B08|nr:SDR family oxidoreductase [Alkanindiges illinoisensis]
MKLTGNTILITGGGSGIGKALAKAFYDKGNKVIIAGRQADKLEAVASAFPGMTFMTVDMTSLASITAFSEKIIAEHPDLNVIINNAGIMIPEDLLTAPANLEIAERTVLTNLLGPIRLTSSLLPHLMHQKSSTIMMVTSGLAFVPLVMTPTYNATKAALHSYSIALRQQLKDTSTEVIEIIPPYVQTELMGTQQASDPHAMPLADFIDEVMLLLEKNNGTAEIVVERCKPLRYAAETHTFGQTFTMLNQQHSQ